MLPSLQAGPAAGRTGLVEGTRLPPSSPSPREGVVEGRVGGDREIREGYWICWGMLVPNECFLSICPDSFSVSFLGQMCSDVRTVQVIALEGSASQPFTHLILGHCCMSVLLKIRVQL